VEKLSISCPWFDDEDIRRYLVGRSIAIPEEFDGALSQLTPEHRALDVRQERRGRRAA
jgi:hypothetical protein